jgi:hypothetical protein
MPENAISANSVRPVDLQPQTYTLQLNGGTEAIVQGSVPRPLDLTLESQTISLGGGGTETVVNIAAPRKVASLVQYGIPGFDGAPGVDADQVEFQVVGDMLQWRRVGQVAWNDLVDLATVVPGTLWGLVGGTLANQTDLQSALDAKLDDAQASVYGLSLLDDVDAATARATLNVDVAGTAATLDAAHLAAGDPHPQYLTPAEGNAAYSLLGHTHLLANVTDVTMTVANLNALDDGVNTALHFHDSDRARANHTGTQLASTISDFNEAAQDAIGAMLDATLVYVDGTPALGRAAISGHITIAAGSNTAALGSFTMAQLDAAVSDGNVSYAGHTHLLANFTDVTMTVANLNALDDGVNTALHFHDSDRARANHTGLQLAATVSDFNSAADARVAAGIAAASVNALADVTVTAPVTGQVLKWNGSAWVNDADATGGAGSTLTGTETIAFSDGDTTRRVTITNASITTASVIAGLVRRPDSATDGDDKGYLYSCNIVRQVAGAFDLLVNVTDWGGADCSDDPPNETITFHYMFQ